jgi:hypothetical protein
VVFFFSSLALSELLRSSNAAVWIVSERKVTTTSG